MSLWQGQEKSVAPTEIQPTQSPDTVNTFHYNQTLGLLGSRAGFTQSKQPVFSGYLTNGFPFIGPWGTIYITPTTNGDIIIYDNVDDTAGLTSDTGWANLGDQQLGMVWTSAGGAGSSTRDFNPDNPGYTYTGGSFQYGFCRMCDTAYVGGAMSFYGGGGGISFGSNTSSGSASGFSFTAAHSGGSGSVISFVSGVTGPIGDQNELYYPFSGSGTVTGAIITRSPNTGVTVAASIWAGG